MNRITTGAAAKAGYVYATLFPSSGVVKIGMGQKRRWASGQTYEPLPLKLLGIWHVEDMVATEKRAHQACKSWHVEGGGLELFKGEPALIVAVLEALLSPITTTPKDPVLYQKDNFIPEAGADIETRERGLRLARRIAEQMDQLRTDPAHIAKLVKHHAKLTQSPPPVRGPSEATRKKREYASRPPSAADVAAVHSINL